MYVDNTPLTVSSAHSVALSNEDKATGTKGQHNTCAPMSPVIS